MVWCVCVCGGWFLCSAVQASGAITMLVFQPLAAGETGQVKRQRGMMGEDEGRRGAGI